MCFLLYF